MTEYSSYPEMRRQKKEQDQLQVYTVSHIASPLLTLACLKMYVHFEKSKQNVHRVPKPSIINSYKCIWKWKNAGTTKKINAIDLDSKTLIAYSLSKVGISIEDHVHGTEGEHFCEETISFQAR